jgi:hypothetical protein
MNRERLTPDRIRRLTLPEGAGQSFLGTPTRRGWPFV